jgi:transcription elongation factor GreA
MNIHNLKQMVAAGNMEAVESAWMEAVEEGMPAEQLAEAVGELVSGGHGEAAATLVWALVTELAEQRGPAEALSAAAVTAPLVPASDDLRETIAGLYRQVHADHEHLEGLLDASGLEAGQSMVRAIETLETCLAIEPGKYLANRFDEQVLRAVGFDAAAGEFELTTPEGRSVRHEPKLLADEFVVVEDVDFRVLCTFRREDLSKMITGDLEAVLRGLCMAHGGRIDSTELKDLLAGTHVEAGKWSSWWSRARNAAKKSEQLSLEGRNPTVIEYHPAGRSLSEEFAGAVEEARVPAELFAALSEYAREARTRHVEVEPEFARPPVERLAEQAREYRRRRPADALDASLALRILPEMGLPAPQAEHPSAEEAVAELEDPAAVIASVADPALQQAAVEAVESRPDAGDQLARLLRMLPVGNLDDIAGRLRRADREDAIRDAVDWAAANPRDGLQLLLWLWTEPDHAPDNAPAPKDLLGRLLTVLEEVNRDPSVDRDFRRIASGQIRNALTANGCGRFRRVIRELGQAVTETVKRRIERADGLAVAAKEELTAVLREEYYELFLQRKVDPWLDESTIWTSSAALARQQARLKDMAESQMLEISKRIGAAAELGDLSENSEWQFAQEEKRRLEARISQLNNDLTRARVITEDDVPADSVGIGSRVTLRREGGEAVTLTFLGPWDTDVAAGVINYKTPLALALMGRSPGERVSLKIEDEPAEYVIDSVEPGV